MSTLTDLTPCELATMSSAIALAIAKDLTADEQNILGNLIVSIGSIILTIAAQGATQQPSTK